jgi:hypothetical protein
MHSSDGAVCSRDKLLQMRLPPETNAAAVVANTEMTSVHTSRIRERTRGGIKEVRRRPRQLLPDRLQQRGHRRGPHLRHRNAGPWGVSMIRLPLRRTRRGVDAAGATLARRGRKTNGDEVEAATEGTRVDINRVEKRREGKTDRRPGLAGIIALTTAVMGARVNVRKVQLRMQREKWPSLRMR